MWYALTSMWPVYLPSTTATVSLFVDDVPFDLEERVEDVIEEDTAGGDSPYAEWNVCDALAGRLRARAALWSKGDSVDEKL